MSIWKPVPEFEDLYEVSDDGQVRSLCMRYKKEMYILKQGIGSRGYANVSLCRKGKQKTVNVHRLVATMFVPNPYSFPCVNHKDQNKLNNKAENLEWCSYYQNNIYGDRLTKSSKKTSKPVLCIETGIRYQSACAAQRITGINQGHISMCCNGKRNTAGGYHWKFVDYASFRQ